jgi:hypothetical protein
VSGKRALVLMLCAAAVVAVVAVYFTRGYSPKGSPLSAREQALQLLGARIAELKPGCKVLVLANPFTRESYLGQSVSFERTGLRGLRKGLGRKSPVKVVFPEIRPEYTANPQSILVPPDSRTPLSYVIRPESVEQLAESNAECGVIVTLIGVPVGVEGLKLWTEKDPRCFAMLFPDLRHLGPPDQVKAAFERGKLLAAVVEDARSGEPLIVTRENVAEVLEKQPKVFGY